ncbi:MAG: hypothetical protein ACTSRL_19055 [Candidatus Helarchaeota archaeon]
MPHGATEPHALAVAKRTARLLKFPPTEVVFIALTPCSQLDMNRAEARGSPYRIRVAEAIRQHVPLALFDTHAFDPEAVPEWRRYDVLIFEFPGREAQALRLYAAFQQVGAQVGLVRGDIANDIVMQVPPPSQAFLLEFNAERVSDRLAKLFAAAIKRYIADLAESAGPGRIRRKPAPHAVGQGCKRWVRRWGKRWGKRWVRRWGRKKWRSSGATCLSRYPLRVGGKAAGRSCEGRHLCRAPRHRLSREAPVSP